MTRPEIEALLEGAYFPDAETRKAVIARVSEAIPQWLPIETAPYAEELIAAIINKNGRVLHAEMTNSCYSIDGELEWDGWDDLPPTHWQPLPKGPAND